MTRLEMVNLIQFRMGRRTDLASEIAAEIQNAQIQLEHDHTIEPYFLFKTGTLSTEDGTETVALPTDFLREATDTRLMLYDEDDDETEFTATQLAKDTYGVIRNFYQGGGRPERYCVRGKSIYLRPIPDAVYTIRIDYYGKDDTLDADGDENFWSTDASDLLMAHALWLVSRYVKDKDLAAIAAEDIRMAKERLNIESASRAATSMEMTIGDDF